MGLPSVKPRVVRAKETEQRTVPTQYIADLELLNALLDDVSDFITYVNVSIYDTQRSFLTSVPKSLIKLLNAYVLPDMETALSSLDTITRFYNKDYSQLEKSTIDILGRLSSNLFSFITSFEDDDGFLAGDLESVFITMHSLDTLLDTYIEMPREPDGPKNVFGQGNDCKLDDLLRDARILIENIEGLGNQSTQPHGMDPYQSIIKDTYNMFSVNAGKMEKCLSYCSEQLETTRSWFTQTNMSIGAEIPALTQFAKIETVTNSLDFFTDYTEILDFKEVLRNATQGYMSGEWTLQKIADIFSDETIEGLSKEFKQFLGSFQVQLLMYKDLREETSEVVVKAYNELGRHLLDLGKFYGSDDYQTKAQAMNIWKSPVSSVEDPTNPSVSDSIRIDNLSNFLKTQAAKIISDIVNGYSENIVEELLYLYSNLDDVSTKLMTKVNSAKTHYGKFLKDTSVDHDFVK